MTTKEAWIIIAESFEEQRTFNSIGYCGLCNAVTSLWVVDDITDEQKHYMESQIEIAIAPYSYLNNDNKYTDEMRPVRAALARKLADESI